MAPKDDIDDIDGRAPHGDALPELAAVIAALILERPMCLPCITTKAAVSEPRAETVLALIKSAFVLRREPGDCRACGATDVRVISVRRRG